MERFSGEYFDELRRVHLRALRVLGCLRGVGRACVCVVVVVGDTPPPHPQPHPSQ